MPLHYDATSDFHSAIAEVETLLTLASSDDANRTLFLKLSMVSIVTKFQVFVEKILAEFRYQLNDKSSGKYIRTNGLSVLASPFVLRELSEILGAENVVLR